MNSTHSCSVCSSEQTKYKCPTCRVPYCSLICCQTHKSTCVTPETKEVDRERIEKTEQRVLWDQSSDHAVPTEALGWLGGSRRLRQLLANPHLRELVRQADSTPHPEDDLRRLMVEPLFAEFADECLRVVEGLPEPDEDSD